MKKTRTSDALLLNRVVLPSFSLPTSNSIRNTKKNKQNNNRVFVYLKGTGSVRVHNDGTTRSFIKNNNNKTEKKSNSGLCCCSLTARGGGVENICFLNNSENTQTHKCNISNNYNSNKNGWPLNPRETVPFLRTGNLIKCCQLQDFVDICNHLY